MIEYVDNIIIVIGFIVVIYVYLKSKKLIKEIETSQKEIKKILLKIVNKEAKWNSNI